MTDVMPSQWLSALRVVIGTTALMVVTGPSRMSAQVPQIGQNVVPVYEGWESNADGSLNLVFGYFNRNWDEEIDIPVGPDNNIEPSGPDQAQPTHFLPGRNRFLLRIRVPKD